MSDECDTKIPERRDGGEGGKKKRKKKKGKVTGFLLLLTHFATKRMTTGTLKRSL